MSDTTTGTTADFYHHPCAWCELERPAACARCPFALNHPIAPKTKPSFIHL